MYEWDCCRTCLSVQNLFPIFPSPEHIEKFTEVIFTTTGLKMEPSDTLPQVMCTACIRFINESYKFRRKCVMAQTHLLNNINSKDLYNVKIEMPIFEVESHSTAIEISSFNNIDNEFKDYDDNVPLDSLQLENNIDFTENIVSDYKKDDLESHIESTAATICKKRKKTQSRDITKERKPRTKKEIVHNKDVGDRVRENIECEYCHKVLTSKLSLRNHYKIHTGFDVVCEHCGKKFITRRLLLMHCRAKHGYEKTDKCSFCDYRASNAEQVKIHERLHTGEKPYVCGECKAGFHRKSSYLQHIAIHLPEKNVQCDQCPARFKSVTLMRIHKNRHRAPQYSFRCRVCENTFARRRNVARHLQRVHGLAPDPGHIDRLKIV